MAQEYTTNGHPIDKRISLGRRAWAIGDYLVVELMPGAHYDVRHSATGVVVHRDRWIDAVEWVDEQLGPIGAIR